ncbi:hypothetical protein [Streptomyces sp. NPDC002156]
MGSDDWVVASVEQAIERFERINVLVNNAGIGSLGAYKEHSPAQAQRFFNRVPGLRDPRTRGPGSSSLAVPTPRSKANTVEPGMPQAEGAVRSRPERLAPQCGAPRPSRRGLRRTGPQGQQTCQLRSADSEPPRYRWRFRTAPSWVESSSRGRHGRGFPSRPSTGPTKTGPVIGPPGPMTWVEGMMRDVDAAGADAVHPRA